MNFFNFNAIPEIVTPDAWHSPIPRLTHQRHLAIARAVREALHNWLSHSPTGGAIIDTIEFDGNTYLMIGYNATPFETIDQIESSYIKGQGYNPNGTFRSGATDAAGALVSKPDLIIASRNSKGEFIAVQSAMKKSDTTGNSVFGFKDVSKTLKSTFEELIGTRLRSGERLQKYNVYWLYKTNKDDLSQKILATIPFIMEHTLSSKHAAEIVGVMTTQTGHSSLMRCDEFFDKFSDHTFAYKDIDIQVEKRGYVMSAKLSVILNLCQAQAVNNGSIKTLRDVGKGREQTNKPTHNLFISYPCGKAEASRFQDATYAIPHSTSFLTNLGYVEDGHKDKDKKRWLMARIAIEGISYTDKNDDAKFVETDPRSIYHFFANGRGAASNFFFDQNSSDVYMQAFCDGAASEIRKQILQNPKQLSVFNEFFPRPIGGAYGMVEDNYVDIDCETDYKYVLFDSSGKKVNGLKPDYTTRCLIYEEKDNVRTIISPQHIDLEGEGYRLIHYSLERRKGDIKIRDALCLEGFSADGEYFGIEVDPLQFNGQDIDMEKYISLKTGQAGRTPHARVTAVDLRRVDRSALCRIYLEGYKAAFGRNNKSAVNRREKELETREKFKHHSSPYVIAWRDPATKSVYFNKNSIHIETWFLDLHTLDPKLFRNAVGYFENEFRKLEYETRQFAVDDYDGWKETYPNSADSIASGPEDIEEAIEKDSNVVIWMFRERIIRDSKDPKSYVGDFVEKVKRLKDQQRILTDSAVATTATPFTIGDPNDAGVLDIQGFDTAAPQLISNFVADKF